MSNKRIIWVLIFVLGIFAVSTVSAADNSTEFISTDENSNLSIEENSNYEVLNVSNGEETLSTPKTFSDLNYLINGENNFYVDLNSDYKFSQESDSAFINGIPITRSINIRGNGFTVDASNQARIFNASAYVNFYDLNLINGNSDYGSAIYGSNYAVKNSNFTNNYASKNGGALYKGYAENCTFTNNKARSSGGAMYEGTITNCTMIGNSAGDGGAIYNVYATYSTFISNSASRSSGAMYGSSASYCTFMNNYAYDHSGALGFGYAVNCVFVNNSAYQSGALGGAGSAEKCTFENNYAEEGGAIFGCLATQCTFIANHARQGGAMAGVSSAVDCVFINNYAVDKGGALLEVYALRCNFTGNHADSGGAMYLNSAKESHFTDNYAVSGGAMFNSHGLSCTFTNNTAQNGGAICDGSATSSSFSKNHAVNGGAVYGGSAEGSVLACTFIGNSAEEYGGAIYATSAVRCYFKSNTAKYGGAMSSGSSASESVFIENIAKISGGAKFDSYAGKSNFTGNLPVYTLYVSDFNAMEGFGGNIKIRLSDSPEFDIISENVTINVYNNQNKVIGTYIAETGYNWFVDFPAGKYKAVFTVNDPSFEADSVRITINIQKTSFIYVVKVIANYNDGKCLIVNLHDSNGKAIKYAKVSVTLNGKTKTYTTDENGQVIVSTKGLVPKSYVATINYNGDNTYIKSSASTTVTIRKLTPKLSASAKTFKLSDRYKKYNVILKNNKNVIIKNALIKINVNGKSYSVKTNARGIAAFKFTKLTKKGIFNAVIQFAGNAYYNSIKKTVRITVRK